MVSIDEVAQRAGVSTATVSRALSGRAHVSEATRQRVVQAAKELGYTASAAASSLASGRTKNVGIVVPFLDRWYFSTVLTGISESLVRAGYDVTLYNVTDDQQIRKRIFLSFVQRRRVDGMIVVAMELDERESAQLRQLNIPVIATGGPSPNFNAFAIDDEAVARLAVEHLIRLGHRAIGHIGGNPDFDLDFHVPTRRRQGFEQALLHAGVEPNPALYEMADFTIEGGYRAAKQLLGRPGTGMTAIFAASDEMAIGAILAARDLGLQVPRDLSVIGIDGHSLGHTLQLTTVDQFPQRQGQIAAESMVALLEGKADPHSEQAHDLPYELVVRGTTAAPPAD